jgi:hypothetical protein
MPNQPDIVTKRVLSVRISRELYRKLQKAAGDRKMKFNQFIRLIIFEATECIFLNEKDYEQIGREIHEDLERARAKGRLSKDSESRGTVRR